MAHRWRAWIASALLASAGCTTLEQQPWYGKAHDATARAADVAADQTAKAVHVASDQAGKAYQRMQRYLAEKDLLLTFHDASEHSEGAVLDVLHRAGIGGTRTPAPATAPTQHPPPTSPTRPAPAPGPRTATPLPERYDGALVWPVEAGIVSSEFGQRWGKPHKGMDIAADVGEPVYAIAAGEVIYAGDGMRGYGNAVVLRHDRQRTSLYAHNSALKVKVGDHVAQGTVVALLGNTGHSTGPHVHFEIRDGDRPLNPRSVLPASKLAMAPEETPQDRWLLAETADAGPQAR